jgi:ribosomal protein L7/L12
VASSVQEQVEQIEKRIALIEVRLEQLFEHLNIAPRGGGGTGGVHEGEGLDPNDDPEIQDLLAKGNQVQATKRYQELTGASLNEAKQAIDQAQAED